ncbi:hypothetical protein C5167_012965 [Papaver somniferum]|uniref:Uncharacterized protein n=1 Tax=Papaver somniferum TaxID=3469 RepID=A0A4Y7J221_PAPSO|nr:hypothetical protein C5167_012965 [Papaver somniferum]
MDSGTSFKFFLLIQVLDMREVVKYVACALMSQLSGQGVKLVLPSLLEEQFEEFYDVVMPCLRAVFLNVIENTYCMLRARCMGSHIVCVETKIYRKMWVCNRNQIRDSIEAKKGEDEEESDFVL